MRVDDQTKVTNAIAAAIEYITKFHASSLSGFVVKELRGANAIVSVAAQRELNTMPTPELKVLAQYALRLLAGRERQELPEGAPYPSYEEAFVEIARDLAQPRFELPRISATHIERPDTPEETDR